MQVITYAPSRTLKFHLHCEINFLNARYKCASKLSLRFINHGPNSVTEDDKGAEEKIKVEPKHRSVAYWYFSKLSVGPFGKNRR